MKADPRNTKRQIKTLQRVIQRVKEAGDDQEVKFYTELLEKGGADIPPLEVVPPLIGCL